MHISANYLHAWLIYVITLVTLTRLTRT